MARTLSAAAVAFDETLREVGVAAGDDGFGDPVELGRRAALLAVANAAWRRHLGTLLDARQVQRLLAVGTRQAVSDMLRRGKLLGLPTGKGHVLFPAFQFTEAGRPHSLVAPALEAFERAGVGPYTVASWLISPQPLLDGETPIGWVRRGGEPAVALEAARRRAARLAQ